MIANVTTVTDSLLACAVCMGGDDATTMAANLAIGFMGVLIITILASILKFAHYLSQQQKLAAIQPDMVADLSAKEDR